MRESVLDRIGPSVRNELERLAGPLQAAVLAAHETVETNLARFKRRLALVALKHPWEGLADLERQGLLIAELAEGVQNLPLILEAEWIAPPHFTRILALKHYRLNANVHGRHREASKLRDKALANHGGRSTFLLPTQKLVDISPPDLERVRTRSPTSRPISLYRTPRRTSDYGLIAAAQVLARFANER
jgi:hypothetical protein